MKTYTLKKLTPLMMVDVIEPCLGFWERLGFARTVELPEGNALGFVILVKDDLEIMYQSTASVTGDIPSMASTPKGGTLLFIEVSDLDAVIEALGDAPRVFDRRKTFYGMDEIGVREPGGNAITFAQPT